jgi:SAM-dependent methyltransferase
MSQTSTATLRVESIPPATSVTHLYILSLIAAELSGKQGHYRILDSGCGPAVMLQYLRAALPLVMPGSSFEVLGYDVLDYAPPGHSRLQPDVGIVHGYRGEQWPFADGSFDVIVSNQVLEHVDDHALFFAEVARLLAPRGFSAHLFPLREVIYEGHVFIPLAHRVRHPGFVNAMARLGFRRPVAIPGSDTEDFGPRVVRFVDKYTNYRSERDVVLAANAAGLRASFHYTPHFYWSKLRQLARLSPRYRYSWRTQLGFKLLKRASCITLFLRPNTASA